jgi:hypothetical protein
VRWNSTVRRRDVFVMLSASTIRGACAEAWRQRFAYFAHAGKVYFCLGSGDPARGDDDWCYAGLETKDLL